MDKCSIIGLCSMMMYVSSLVELQRGEDTKTILENHESISWVSKGGTQKLS
jgi:hypothetical protein